MTAPVSAPQQMQQPSALGMGPMGAASAGAHAPPITDQRALAFLAATSGQQPQELAQNPAAGQQAWTDLTNSLNMQGTPFSPQALKDVQANLKAKCAEAGIKLGDPPKWAEARQQLLSRLESSPNVPGDDRAARPLAQRSLAELAGMAPLAPAQTAQGGPQAGPTGGSPFASLFGGQASGPNMAGVTPGSARGGVQMRSRG